MRQLRVRRVARQDKASQARVRRRHRQVVQGADARRKLPRKGQWSIYMHVDVNHMDRSSSKGFKDLE